MTALCWGCLWAATKTVDLNGRPGAESAVDLNVLQTAPPRLEAKVTNKTNGDAFTFSWKSAGPGGFTSSTGVGRLTGVGAKWVWSTNQSVFAFTGAICAKDVCFTKTAGPDPVTTRGPFSVPGRSLFATDVTVSSSALTSRPHHAFFSLPRRCSSHQQRPRARRHRHPGDAAQPLRRLGDRHRRSRPSRLLRKGAINCDGECFDWRTDEGNCGGCGLACDLGAVCTNGSCTTECPEGTTPCGDGCVDTSNDRENCGECGNACGESSICAEGECQGCKGEVCGNACVNLGSDVENCGGCGNDCTLGCKGGAYCYSGYCEIIGGSHVEIDGG
jgi:hypothetical protein